MLQILLPCVSFKLLRSLLLLTRFFEHSILKIFCKNWKTASIVFINFRVNFTTTYIKLQDAYVSESNKVGSWKLIGYVAPGSAKAESEGETTNFKYLAGGTLAANGSDAAVASFNATTWAAVNKVALNECAAQANGTADNANWKITTVGASNGNSLKYTASTSCSQLTPSFDKIGK